MAAVISALDTFLKDTTSAWVQNRKSSLDEKFMANDVLCTWRPDACSVRSSHVKPFIKVYQILGLKGKGIMLAGLSYHDDVVYRVPNSMNVLLRRPVASQSSGSDGLTGEGDEDADEDESGAERRAYGVSMERGVWDEPIIKRWEDAKVGFPCPSCCCTGCRITWKMFRSHAFTRSRT